MRKLTILAAASAALLLPATGAFAQSTSTFTGELRGMNDDNGSATVTIDLDGTTADITIDGNGFFDGFPHAIHLHGEPGGDNVCPSALNPGDEGFDEIDENGDGVISVAEGAAFYGGVATSLTTEGDTSPDSALAVDRFPTSGSLDYQRTIELPQDVADNLATLHVVVHATDLNDSGEIGDFGEPSSLDPELDIEATAPAACGELVTTAGTTGDTGIATGAGGTATGADTAATQAGLLAAGLLGLGATGLVVRRRGLDG